MIRLYERKTYHDMIIEKRAHVMSICGGLICKVCGYTNFQALALSGGNIKNYMKLDYYISHVDQARENITVLCYNCLMWKRNTNKRVKIMKGSHKFHNRQIERIFHILNQFECQNCGISDKRFLEIDHIAGQGNRKLKTLPGRASQERRYYIKHPQQCREDLQILCSNCNQLKKEERMEYGLIHV